MIQLAPIWLEEFPEFYAVYNQPPINSNPSFLLGFTPLIYHSYDSDKTTLCILTLYLGNFIAGMRVLHRSLKDIFAYYTDKLCNQAFCKLPKIFKHFMRCLILLVFCNIYKPTTLYKFGLSYALIFSFLCLLNN